MTNYENRINRNTQEAGAYSHWIEHQIYPEYNEKQKALTEKWIIPYKDSIVQDAERLRELADRILKKEREVKKYNKMLPRNKRYPIGTCGKIRDEVLKLMKNNLLNPEYQGLKAIRNFVKEGGIILPVWGTDSNSYFQNAIQIGTSILDVANDTVDRKKKKVVFYDSLESSPIKPLKNLVQLAEIREKYWGDHIYPNTIFPHIAHIFPILVIGRINPHENQEPKQEYDIFIDGYSVISLGLKNFKGTNEHGFRFDMARDFIFKSKYSGKKIPEKAIKALLSPDSFFNRVLLKKLPYDFELVQDKEEIENMFYSLHQDEKNEAFDTYVKFRRIAYSLTEVSLANFYASKDELD